MKYRKFYLVLSVLLLLTMLAPLTFASSEGKAYVVPIKGEINRATHNYVRDVVNQLNNSSAEAIIFEIDTYGGLVDEAIGIKDIILSTNIPTIGYVNNKAQSAGVLITIANDHIVMAPNSTIGSAETIPNTEKVMSMWRGVLRDTAQATGRDERLVEAMAVTDIEIPDVVEKGKLLNLTAQEAEALEFSELTTNDYKAMLSEFGISADIIETKTEGLQVKLAKWVSNPTISTILLTLGFIGLVLEILTPGFGVGGTISIMSFGLFFAGNILAGNSNWTSLILFLVGLILLVIEGVVPGFGLPGIGGIIFVVGGIFLAMQDVTTAILSMSIAVIVTTIVTIILVKLGFRTNVLNRIILNNKLDDSKGYLSTDSMSLMLDREGLTSTELRPSGFAEFEGVKFDVLAESGFIPKGSAIKVVKVEGSKIFVRRI